MSNITYLQYTNTLSNIKKYFNHMELSDLTKDSYQKALNEFAKTHVKDTAKRFHTHLRACLLEAFDERIILKDVTRNVVITGEFESKKKKEKYLNFNDFKKLIKEIESRLDPRFSSPYLVLIASVTGLRFAELLGLTWKDIHLEELTIKVNKTWNYKTGGGFGLTKNKSSIRTVDIDKKQHLF